MGIVPSDARAGVSVIVCCYNSTRRIRPTLEHLACQVVHPDLRWEVIVVDNASTDGTGAAARAIWGESPSNTPFSVVDQPEPGLSAAREMGLRVAVHDVVVFCDDDNWLAEDYVQNAFESMDTRPKAGAIGGVGTPVFEEPMPNWFDGYRVYYALGPQGESTGDISDDKGYVYGAGLVLRRRAWLALCDRGFTSLLTGRIGASLASSEDRELCYALRLLGYEIHYVASLEFRHEITARRLQWAYFLSMVEMAHRSTPVMEAYAAVLRGDPPLGERSAAWLWVRQCAAIAWRVVRRPRVLTAVVQRKRTSPRAVKWRRFRGSWVGWCSVRHRYGELQGAVRALGPSRQ